MDPTSQPLILASQSPRRALLLREAGFEDFAIVAPEVEEAHEEALAPEALTLENARRKAAWVAERHPEAWVIAADTLVYVDGLPLGKPVDLEEAKRMLALLSGRAHEVCTGVVLKRAIAGWEEAFAVVTRVWFKPLDEGAMRAYHAVCNPLDKAGGYGVQDGTEIILERLEGSFSNVMGLPMEELTPRLQRALG